MRVVIAGGHGKIALVLARLLAERGDEVVGLIRNPAHTGDVEATGARAVVCDLEAATAGELVALLDTPASIGAVLALVAGDTPVRDAVATIPARR